MLGSHLLGRHETLLDHETHWDARVDSKKKVKKKGYLLTYLVSLGFSLADIGDQTWQYKEQWMLNYTINKQVH